MKDASLGLLVLFFLAVHQDSWFWRTAEPMWFGFLPPGFWYHGLYTLAAAGLLALLVKFAWPEHLEREAERMAANQPTSAADRSTP